MIHPLFDDPRAIEVIRALYPGAEVEKTTSCININITPWLAINVDFFLVKSDDLPKCSTGTGYGLTFDPVGGYFKDLLGLGLALDEIRSRIRGNAGRVVGALGKHHVSSILAKYGLRSKSKTSGRYIDTRLGTTDWECIRGRVRPHHRMGNLIEAFWRGNNKPIPMSQLRQLYRPPRVYSASTIMQEMGAMNSGWLKTTPYRLKMDRSRDITNIDEALFRFEFLPPEKW